MALREVESELEAAKCPVCGGPAEECADRANQHAFEVSGRWCYRQKALIESMEAKTKGSKGRIAVGASVLTARLNSALRRG